MRQVLTITPEGGVQGLQVKPGKGFDLRAMGKAKITRASEVLFDEVRQLWYVEVREGNFAGMNIDLTLTNKAAVRLHDIKPDVMDMGVLYFEEYDAAVAAEIAVLDGLRERGLL